MEFARRCIDIQRKRKQRQICCSTRQLAWNDLNVVNGGSLALAVLPLWCDMQRRDQAKESAERALNSHSEERKHELNQGKKQRQENVHADEPEAVDRSKFRLTLPCSHCMIILQSKKMSMCTLDLHDSCRSFVNTGSLQYDPDKQQENN